MQKGAGWVQIDVKLRTYLMEGPLPDPRMVRASLEVTIWSTTDTSDVAWGIFYHGLISTRDNTARLACQAMVNKSNEMRADISEHLLLGRSVRFSLKAMKLTPTRLNSGVVREVQTD